MLKSSFMINEIQEKRKTLKVVHLHILRSTNEKANLLSKKGFYRIGMNTQNPFCNINFFLLCQVHVSYINRAFLLYKRYNLFSMIYYYHLNK